MTVSATYQVYYAYDHWQQSAEEIRAVEFAHVADLEKLDKLAIWEASVLEKATFPTKSACKAACVALKLADSSRRAAYYAADWFLGH